MAEHIFSVWPEILDQLKGAKHILLLTDYDGTLTPIAESPELAQISQNILQLLQALADRPYITLGIISGRSLLDLKSRVCVKGAVYAGNHGVEIEGPDLSFIAPGAEEVRPLLQTLAMQLTLALKSIPGVFVEYKVYSLSVHYRQMPEDKIYDLKNAFEFVIDNSKIVEKFKVTPGKKVYEIKPEIDWDKGKAIRLLMNSFRNWGNKEDSLPVYLGDDVTDEDGFRAIRHFGYGVTIHIGDNIFNTVADYYLRSPEETRGFLRRMLESPRIGLK
jgi:trehalose 6-phosphate phosphatase